MTDDAGLPTVARRAVLGGLVAAAGAATGVVLPPGSTHPAALGPGFERSATRPAPPGDDTARLNAMFARGGEVVVPAREYSVSVDERGSCLVLDVPSTRVRFAPGAVIRLRPTRLAGYAVLSLSAADCVVTGGVVVGDLQQHAGSEGEWGHGVSVDAGADRCVLEGVRSTECWGDGFYVAGAVTDVRLVGCVGQDNRRQGLSVVDAVRPRVVGGSYGRTGRLGHTVPASGIDLEPNPGGAVVGAVVERVSLVANRGHGLLVSARHGPVDAVVSGCSASRNGDAGYLVDGPGARVDVRDCTAAANARGVVVADDVTGFVAARTVASGGTGHGFVVEGAGNRLVSCTASGNGGSGFLVRASASGAVLDRCHGASNSTAAVLPDFDVAAPGARLVGVRSTVGAGRASSAVVLRETAVDATVVDGSWTGAYAVAPFQDRRAVTP